MPATTVLSDDQDRARKAFLTNVFGSANEDAAMAVSLQSYLSYVEESLEDISRTIAPDHIKRLCSDPSSANQDAPIGLLDVASKIAGVLQQEMTDHKQSIDGVIAKTISISEPEDVQDPAFQQACRYFVFAVLGLSTMLFTPMESKSSTTLEASRRNSNAEKPIVIPVDLCKKPIRTLLARLGVSPTDGSMPTLS